MCFAPQIENIDMNTHNHTSNLIYLTICFGLCFSCFRQTRKGSTKEFLGSKHIREHKFLINMANGGEVRNLEEKCN